LLVWVLRFAVHSHLLGATHYGVCCLDAAGRRQDGCPSLVRAWRRSFVHAVLPVPTVLPWILHHLPVPPRADYAGLAQFLVDELATLAASCAALRSGPPVAHRPGPPSLVLNRDWRCSAAAAAWRGGSLQLAPPFRCAAAVRFATFSLARWRQTPRERRSSALFMDGKRLPADTTAPHGFVRPLPGLCVKGHPYWFLVLRLWPGSLVP